MKFKKSIKDMLYVDHATNPVLRTIFFVHI